MDQIALYISLAALIVSVWTRIEAFFVGIRERRADFVRRTGEAFVAAQECKNALSNLIHSTDQIRSTLKPVALQAMEESLVRWRRDYVIVQTLVGEFENILLSFERGESAAVSWSVIEAKIARFNQVRLLASYDTDFLKQLSYA